MLTAVGHLVEQPGEVGAELPDRLSMPDELARILVDAARIDG